MSTQTNPAAGHAAGHGASSPGSDLNQLLTDTPAGRTAPRRQSRKSVNRELRRAEYERRAQAAEKRRARMRAEQEGDKRTTASRTDEEDWVCLFCEYEDLFGVRPKTLIRQYEMKELKQRRKDEERQKHLAKARAKSRKGKRNGKTAAKGGHNDSQQAHDYHQDVGLHPYDGQPGYHDPAADDDGEFEEGAFPPDDDGGGQVRPTVPPAVPPLPSAAAAMVDSVERALLSGTTPTTPQQ